MSVVGIGNFRNHNAAHDALSSISFQVKMFLISGIRILTMERYQKPVFTKSGAIYVSIIKYESSTILFKTKSHVV